MNLNLDGLMKPEPEHDPVNHPSHYCDGGIETIDFIEAKNLPYHLGNAVKYISRAGKKDDEVQDLKKAVWYINRYIELINKNKAVVVDADNQVEILDERTGKLEKRERRLCFNCGYCDPFLSSKQEDAYCAKNEAHFDPMYANLCDSYQEAKI